MDKSNRMSNKNRPGDRHYQSRRWREPVAWVTRPIQRHYHPYYSDDYNNLNPVVYPSHNDSYGSGQAPDTSEINPAEGKLEQVTQSVAQVNKKEDFMSFLQTFSTFLMDAKNKEDDLNLLKDVLRQACTDKVASTLSNTLEQRLNEIEKCLLDLPTLSTKLVNVENQLESRETLNQRISSLEKIVPTITAVTVERIKILEDKLSRIDSDLQCSSNTNEVPVSDSNINKRLSSLESRMLVLEANTKQLRTDSEDSSVENISSGASETLPISSSNVESSSNISFCQDTPEKRTHKQTNENKPRVEEPDVMQFIVGDDDFVVVHIDGCGGKSNYGSPGVRIWFGDNHPLNVSRPLPLSTSETKANLLAAQIAMDIGVQAGLQKLLVYSSSKYIVKCPTKLSEWHRQHWKKKNGELLKHHAELKRLRRTMMGVTVKFMEEKIKNKARSLIDGSLGIKKEPE